MQSHLRIRVPGDRLGIKLWLFKHDRNIEWLAQQVGVSASYITMILAGRRTPSLKLAKKLAETTGVAATKFIAPDTA